DAQFARFDALDLLAVPLDEPVHRWIARQHQRQDGHGALAYHVGLDFSPALSLDPSCGNWYEPLAELLRQWRQQQTVNPRLILATEPFTVVALVQVHRGGILAHLHRERSHQLRIAAARLPNVEGDRSWRLNAESLPEDLEDAAHRVLQLLGVHAR